jgi:hypothetical protein
MFVDRWLQDQVLMALQHESGVDAAHIGVSVLDGVVTLQGIVPTFRQKWLAERAARRLLSVRAIANNLEVVASHCHSGGATRLKTLAALALALSLPAAVAAQEHKCGSCARERHDHANAAEQPAPAPTFDAPASITPPPYDARQEGVISGVIYSVMRHPGMDVQLTVGVGEWSVDVLVAPKEWLDAKRVVFRMGERIAIVGSRYDNMTSEAVIARELYTSDLAIVVRDADGRPLWN